MLLFGRNFVTPLYVSSPRCCFICVILLLWMSEQIFQVTSASSSSSHQHTIINNDFTATTSGCSSCKKQTTTHLLSSATRWGLNHGTNNANTKTMNMYKTSRSNEKDDVDEDYHLDDDYNNDNDDEFWSTFSGSMYVDYGTDGHPFENQPPSEQNVGRDTQEQQQPLLLYEPIRISFASFPIKKKIGTNVDINNQIDKILNSVLVNAAQKWAQHLSVVPVQGALAIGPGICNNKYTDIPYEEFNNTDLVIVVDGEYDEPCRTALAYAAVCVTDQIGRPILGFMNFCLNKTISYSGGENSTSEETTGDALEQLQTIVNNAYGAQLNKTLRESQIDANLASVTVHEMGHILGVLASMFLYYRNKEQGGIPYTTPINATNGTYPIIQKRCANGTIATAMFPSDNIVQTIQNSVNGRWQQFVVTPRLRQVAQNHFNCTTVVGGRLEDHQGCIGSHWHERVLYSELLSPLISSIGQNELSPFTLALLDDSGWYQVDYYNSQLPSYGINAGCDFLNNDCVVNDTTKYMSEFCTSTLLISSSGTVSEESLHNVFCDPTHTSFAVCDLFQFRNDSASFANLSSAFTSNISYFMDPYKRPQVTTADGCPIPAIPLGLDCTKSDTYNAFYPGEQVGPTSRCFNAYYNTTISLTTNLPTKIYQPACMNVVCDEITYTAYIRVGDNVTFACQEEGQIISLPNNSGYIICPRLQILCPNLFACPGSCSGRGVCLLNPITNRPYCNCTTNSNSTLSSIFQDYLCSDPAVIASRKTPVPTMVVPTTTTTTVTSPGMTPSSNTGATAPVSETPEQTTVPVPTSTDVVVPFPTAPIGSSSTRTIQINSIRFFYNVPIYSLLIVSAIFG